MSELRWCRADSVAAVVLLVGGPVAARLAGDPMSVLIAAVEPPSFGTVLLVVAAVWLLPTVGVFAWVWADRAADAWLDRHGLIPVDEPDAAVVPLTDAPGFDRITNPIAANEAARADWDEPASWGDPA